MYQSYIKSYSTNCFREHVQESIVLNTQRKKLYRGLTEGQSDRIFTTLIASEVLTLAPATVFDLKARRFQRQGMDLLCHELMSMQRVPDFGEPVAVTDRFREVNWKFYKTRLEIAVRNRNAKSLRTICVDAMAELRDMPKYYCMLRHLFESIYRFGFFLPLRSEEAKKLGIDSPEPLLLDIVRLHLLGLEGSNRLDLWCHPIQEAGVPILFSELPDLLQDLESPELLPLKS